MVSYGCSIGQIPTQNIKSLRVNDITLMTSGTGAHVNKHVYPCTCTYMYTCTYTGCVHVHVINVNKSTDHT